MNRMILRLVLQTLPALIVAVIWWGWWLFGDRPIKVSRPPEPMRTFLFNIGGTGRTILETASKLEPKESWLWRDLETGNLILPMGELNKVSTQISDNERALIVVLGDEYYAKPIRLYDRLTQRVTHLPVSHASAWGWPIQHAGHRIAYQTKDEAIIVVDVDTHNITHHFPDLRRPVRFCPMGRFIVGSVNESTLVMRDLDFGREFTRPTDKPLGRLSNIEIGPGGRRILIKHWKKVNDDEAIESEIWSTDWSGIWSNPEPTWEFQADVEHGYFTVYTRDGETSRLWDINTWPPKEIVDRKGPLAALFPRISDDGKYGSIVNRDFKEWQISDAPTFDNTRSGPMPENYKGSGLSGNYLVIRSDAKQHLMMDRLIKMLPFLGPRSKFQNTFIRLKPGSAPRVIPRDRFWMAEEDGFVWTTSVEGDDGIYELWSLAPPRTPWWLWVLSAMMVGLYGWRITMRKQARPTTKSIAVDFATSA